MDSAGLLAARKASLRGDPIAGLFPKQRAFLDDPSKTKAAVCGRRAGKTWSIAVGLWDAARKHKRSLNPYICLSGVSARRIMWPVLEDLNERHGLGMKMHSHELIAELPNGSQIFCVGGDDMRKVEALRGGKYGRVAIDEAGSFPRMLLRYLHDDVLDAALMDLDGDLWFCGSPNAACAGHFYDITTGTAPDIAKVATHHWNVLDNVHIAHAAEWLANKRAAKRWAEDNPIYRREYLGHWVKDTSWLVFRFDRARHFIVTPPPVATSAVLGVDLGASDEERTTAFVVAGWSKHNKVTRALHAKKFPRLNPEAGAKEVASLMKRFPIGQIVVDEGGLGKIYAEEWRTRFGLNAVAAEKKNKMTYVEFMNGEFDADRALVHAEAVELADELDLLQWDEERKDYDDRFADHAADAWLYAWRECYSWGERDRKPAGPPRGSAEWLAEQAAIAKEKAVQDSMRKTTGPWFVR